LFVLTPFLRKIKKVTAKLGSYFQITLPAFMTFLRYTNLIFSITYSFFLVNKGKYTPLGFEVFTTFSRSILAETWS